VASDHLGLGTTALAQADIGLSPVEDGRIGAFGMAEKKHSRLHGQAPGRLGFC
jgi:hypothetical protein